MEEQLHERLVYLGGILTGGSLVGAGIIIASYIAGITIAYSQPLLISCAILVVAGVLMIHYGLYCLSHKQKEK